MSTRRGLVTWILSACIVFPVVIGASCPPPTNPIVISIVPDNTGNTLQTVPACIEGFVCVNLANGAAISVNMALYTDDGFDPNNIYQDPQSFSCWTNPNSQTACPCDCPGRATGNCRLTRPQIFQAINLTPVNGLQTVTLAPNQSVLTRIRCGDVKTLGASVAQTPNDPVTAPVDQNGPVYRDDPGGVPCGQTVQFLTTDLNQTGGGTGSSTDLATLIIRTQFSK
jgi:hypothetical protein